MTGGVTLSAGTRTRACCWAERAGRGKRRSALLGRAEKEEEKWSEMKILFFFFKNMNSVSFCLFH
jgi:hypothetical protein